MKKKNQNNVIAWLLLILLITASLGLTYLKFFNQKNKNISNTPIDSQKNKDNEKKLDEIVKTINENTEVKDLETKENIKISALRKNNSIFIEYSTEEETITYEFVCTEKTLITTIDNDEENIKIFNKVYKFLVLAIQKNLNNTEKVEEYIDDLLENNTEYNSVSITKDEKTNTYYAEIDRELTIKNTDETENINNNNEPETTNNQAENNNENSTETVEE